MMPQHADTEDAAEVLEALSTKKTIREIVDFLKHYQASLTSQAWNQL